MGASRWCIRCGMEFLAGTMHACQDTDSVEATPEYKAASAQVEAAFAAQVEEAHG